jgi:hypothetical protein
VGDRRTRRQNIKIQEPYQKAKHKNTRNIPEDIKIQEIYQKAKHKNTRSIPEGKT